MRARSENTVIGDETGTKNMLIKEKYQSRTKEKKRREQLDESSTVSASADGTNEESKKKKKRKHSAASPDKAEELADQGNIELEKKKKKQKQKHKKHKEEQSADEKADASKHDDEEHKKGKDLDGDAWDAQPSKKRIWASVGDHKLAQSAEPFPRNFYKPSERTRALTENEVTRVREQSQIGCDPPHFKPVLRFNDVNFPESVMMSVQAFQTPSPIQSQAFPVALSGYDMIGIAATGSGKTLAFGLPALVQILAFKNAPPVRAPRALILSPTRELAQQTAGVMVDAGSKCGIKAACVYGGANKKKQLGEVLSNGGSRLIVATPGRLQDYIENDELRTDYISYLVVDEADRMLDLGFEPAIRDIARRIRADRQTLMFSATWPEKIQSLASEFLSEPVHVRIGSEELKASHSIKQIVEVCQPHEKDDALDSLLQQYHAPEQARVLVFALYKKEAANLEKAMKKRGWECQAIHGDMPQYERSARVAAFKEGSLRLLIATDVAARGLDIPNVECVINYTFPLTTEVCLALVYLV